ncbi:MAG: DUF4062 domain-containing protein [Treponema sp.]|jgi:hypothetical protein|nr:DUF4062 domain-containing protein [Treponema sp.]
MKYNIFIGSTLDDLKNERRDVPRIIMELGHIPVTAEYLDNSSNNYEQLLDKTIEGCDYFIAVTAHRYAQKGEKTSALENECNIALKKNIPVIALVIDNKARWKAAKREKERALNKKLDEFKKKLKEGPHETWLNSTDLCQKLTGLLIMQTRLSPQKGWVRGDQAVLPHVANELSRLSSENEQLRRHIKMESGEFTAKLHDQMKNALKVLALNKIVLSFFYSSGENWENSRQFRYLRVFKLLVPELAVGKTTAEVSRFLGSVLNPDLDKTVRKDYPTPSNTVKKIMADFSTLKLVKCVNADESAGEDEIWEVTEYGKELYSAYRMRQMEKVFVRQDTDEAEQD